MELGERWCASYTIHPGLSLVHEMTQAVQRRGKKSLAYTSVSCCFLLTAQRGQLTGGNWMLPGLMAESQQILVISG